MCFGGKSAEQMYQEMKPEPVPLPSLSFDSVTGSKPQFKDVKKPSTKRKGMTKRSSLLSTEVQPMEY
jgi:hypothetical protein|tara:strand:- start:628 stop:828 length:201 start_codon:yes stop_codon:yes gene_type:complete